MLETRLCPSNAYNYAIVASTGENVSAPSGTTVGALTNLAFPSINDSGNVGFLGTINGFNGVDEGTLSNGSYALTDLSFTNRNFTFPEIDNFDDVIAQDTSSGFSFIRTWLPNGTWTLDASGSTSSGNTVLLPTISPDGMQIAYVNLASNLTLVINGVTAHTFPAGSGGLRPMVANTGAVVVRDGGSTTSPIILIAGQSTVTVGDPTDFDVLGASPGISPDGQVATFYGDLTASGAAAINSSQPNLAPLTAGPGIFASIATGTSSRVIIRVAGTGHGGPVDVNTFDPDNRVGVTSINHIVTNDNYFTVAFMGQDSGGHDGIYTNKVVFIGPATSQTTYNPGMDTLIAQAGDSITGVSGSIQSLSIYAPINKKGEIAFVVNNGGGVMAAVVAEPGFTPAQIRTAYGINSLSLDGSGQTIAIVDPFDDPNILQDVDAFDKQFGITSSGQTLFQQYGAASSFLTKLNENGNATSFPGSDTTGAAEEEIALDVEWAHAIAPRAKIDLIECGTYTDGNYYLINPDGTNGDIGIGIQTASSLAGVSVVSISLLFPEFKTAAAQTSFDNTYFNKAGVTFLAASGDDGSNDPSYPAFSPNVVAVGGTTLAVNSDNTYSNEIGWGNSYQSAILDGSAGGMSKNEPEPHYQMSSQSTGSRTIPDVAFAADWDRGAAVENSHGAAGETPWTVKGGTSWATPCWAGLIALVNQGRVAVGKTVLNGSQALAGVYSLPGDFHDITSGNNGFPAGPGYDLVTGLGTPIANLLVPDLVGKQFVTLSPTSVPDSTVGVAYSQVITASAGIGSKTVNYTVTSGAVPAGLTFSTSTNQLVIGGTPTATGTVDFTVTATDTVGDTATQDYTLTINSAVSLTPTSIPASTEGVAYSQTITASNGTGNKTVTYNITSGTIPAGLTFTTSTDQLVISGTPTASSIVSFNVTATDTVGATATQAYTLTINPAVSLSPTSLPAGTVGIAYSQAISAGNGTGNKTLTYSITSGTIPAGLTFTPSTDQLTISGTPTSTGTVDFSVTATDTVGATATQSYTLIINGISGQTDQWTGANAAVDTNWSDFANWSLGVVPSTVSPVLFTNNSSVKAFTATVDASFTSAIPSLTIDSTWGGTITVNHTLSVTGNFTLASGTFGGNGSVTIAGKASQWTGGQINLGTGGLTNNGTLTINTGSGSLVLAGPGTLTNNKGMIQTGTGNLSLNGNATLNNTSKGTYDIQGNGGIAQSGGGTVVNAGTFKKSKGTGTAAIAATTLNNTGAVDVLSGTMSIAATVSQISANTLTAGTWMVSGSSTVHSTLDITSGSFTSLGSKAKVTLSGLNTTFTNLGSLTTVLAGGSFTLAANQSFTTAGALTNNGSITLSPGSILTVSGSFTEGSTGKLTLQMGLVSSTTQVGTIVSTTGTVSLGGSLSVTSTAVPAVGSSFGIIDNEGNSAVSGTFAGLAEGATFTVKKGTTTMTFKISYVGTDTDGTINVVITRIL